MEAVARLSAAGQAAVAFGMWCQVDADSQPGSPRRLLSWLRVWVRVRHADAGAGYPGGRVIRLGDEHGRRCLPAREEVRVMIRGRRVLVLLACAAVVWGGGPGAVASAAGGGADPAARAAGSWGRAIEVPGLAALDEGGYVSLTSLSCGAAGNGAAGGYYTDVHGYLQGFVVSMRRGRWDRAIEVPGLAALNNGAYAADDGAYVSSVSCAAAGNCAAVGHYL